MPCFCVFLQRLSNGSIDSTDDTSQIVELQELLEKQNYEMAQMKERLTALSSRVGEVEQEAETARKDLIKTEEMNTKYQRDIREVGGTYHSLTLLFECLPTDYSEKLSPCISLVADNLYFLKTIIRNAILLSTCSGK